MSSESEISLASTYRIIKKYGAERVSDEAANELRKILENLGEKIATSSQSNISCRQKNNKI